MKGYIKIHMGLLLHPALQKKNKSLCEIGAFVWLLLEASFLPRKYRIQNAEIDLKRGQLCCSVSYMAQAWNWDKSKVQRYLARLKHFDTITSDTPNDTSADIPNIITICHYDDYQDMPNDTPNDNKQNKLIRINDKNVDDFIYIWSKLRAKRGSKKVALQKYNKIKHKVDKDTLVEKYNQIVKKASSFEFIPHFSTFLSQERWLDEDSIVAEKKITPEQFFRKKYPNTVPDGFVMTFHSWNEITFTNGKEQVTFNYMTGKKI